jgi:hypothetical protein
MARSTENPKLWDYFERHAQYIAPGCYFIIYEGSEIFAPDPNELFIKLESARAADLEDPERLAAYAQKLHRLT